VSAGDSYRGQQPEVTTSADDEPDASHRRAVDGGIVAASAALSPPTTRQRPRRRHRRTRNATGHDAVPSTPPVLSSASPRGIADTGTSDALVAWAARRAAAMARAAQLRFEKDMQPTVVSPVLLHDTRYVFVSRDPSPSTAPTKVTARD
jgi:hypothetical protein